MKCTLKKLIICIFLSLIVLPIWAQDTINIISFNDFHGAYVHNKWISGCSSLVDLVLKEKKKNDIVVSVGDNFSGSYFSQISREKFLYEMFDMMGVELSAIGNHEFDWGINFLEKTNSKIPYVAANVISSRKICEPYKIIERRLKNGKLFKIAFVGMTTTRTVNSTGPENLTEITFVKIDKSPVFAELERMKRLGKIDMVVLLIHSPREEIPVVKCVDAVVMGDSHELLLEDFHGIPIVQAGSCGMYIGKLSFEINHGKVKYIGGDTIPNVGRGTNALEQHLSDFVRNRHLDKPIAVIENNIGHGGGDSFSIGELVTKSYVAYFQKMNVDTSLLALPVIGMNHYGGIRMGLLKGEVTPLEVGSVLPYCGKLGAYLFDGARLKSLLELGSVGSGYLLHSGLELTVEDKKVLKIIYNGSEIKDDTLCIIVLDNYLINDLGGCFRKMFPSYSSVESFNQKKFITTIAFIEYIKNIGYL